MRLEPRKHSSRQVEPERPSVLGQGVAAVGRVVSANPVLIGGATAFLVAISFVSANAVWYQPHAHKGTFFATRDHAADFGESDRESGTTFVIERRTKLKADPATERVQTALRSLGIYEGVVDGLAGPATRKAVEEYQRRVGLPVTGRIDPALTRRLDGETPTAAIAPLPSARRFAALPESELPAVAADADARIVKVQAGLRAFGNDLEIDGVVGSRTRKALAEFQALFGLPETGEPDDATLAKMREVGLAD